MQQCSMSNSFFGASSASLALLVFCYRISVLLLLRTSYVPDEYYQHSEAAFQAAFPTSCLSPSPPLSISPSSPLLLPSTVCSSQLTWEWRDDVRIRSYVPLLPLILLYKTAAAVLPPNWQGDVIAVLPRLLQTVITLSGDYHFYLLAKWCVDPTFAGVAMLVHLFSWFGTYCFSRTLSNSTEATLVIIVTYYLLRHNEKFHCFGLSISNLTLSVFLACVSIFVRPTIGIIWAPLFYFLICHGQKINVLKCLKVIAISLFTIQSAVLIDTWFYRRFTLVPLNFFMANIMNKRAESFGTSSWHFYFTNALPTVLGLYFPYLIFGIMSKNVPFYVRFLANISFWNIVALSVFSRHAEHRFLLSSLPFIHLLISWIFFNNDSQVQFYRPVVPLLKSFSFGKWFISVVFVLHVALAFYLIRYHQCGTENAFSYLRSKELIGPATIILAGTCFSYPGVAYMYSAKSSFRIKQLPCYPPWEAQDIFNTQPSKGFYHLLREVNDELNMTYFLVTFDAYLPHLATQVPANNFQLVMSFDHAHFRYDLDDPFPKYKVLILELIY